MNKDRKYRFEGVLVRGLFAFSRALPLDVASWLGGRLAEIFGPIISYKAHGIAEKNLAMIFPDMPKKEREKIREKMWNNLGRTAAELPHLPSEKLFACMKVSGTENALAAGQPMIFFSGHFGNWELTYPIAQNAGIETALIYRHANNKYVDDIITGIRASRCASQFPKGPRGAVKMAHALKKGYSLAMLVDQKMNDGISVPFFGLPAMTAPAVAILALRYDLPIIPARIVRTGGAHFEGTVFPPLAYEKTGDDEKDILTIMTVINKMLEGWIRENPEQWFWVHRRWPKDVTA
ncbi:MAG: lauroyl acyltransferase [Alphaproteobacteria bacterium]|nr:lauroyl acyltransferase [Alphaproteobacteria bacterium]